MRAVDTNVLLRLLMEDDPRQTKAAEAYVEKGAWVSQLVLVETIWVLASSYDTKPSIQAAAIGMILKHEMLVVQDAEVVAEALELFIQRPTLGFSDCMMLKIAKQTGHLPLGTFDLKLSKADGVERV